MEEMFELGSPGFRMANLPAFILIATGLVVFTKEGGVVQRLQRMLCAHLFTKKYFEVLAIWLVQQKSELADLVITSHIPTLWFCFRVCVRK